MLALHCFRTLHRCVFSMWCWLKISLFDTYRPELHYMRGPGPKWREKHARSVGAYPGGIAGRLTLEAWAKRAQESSFHRVLAYPRSRWPNTPALAPKSSGPTVEVTSVTEANPPWAPACNAEQPLVNGSFLLRYNN